MRYTQMHNHTPHNWNIYSLTIHIHCNYYCIHSDTYFNTSFITNEIISKSHPYTFNVYVCCSWLVLIQFATVVYWMFLCSVAMIYIRVVARCCVYSFSVTTNVRHIVGTQLPDLWMCLHSVWFLCVRVCARVCVCVRACFDTLLALLYVCAARIVLSVCTHIHYCMCMYMWTHMCLVMHDMMLCMLHTCICFMCMLRIVI